MSSEFDKWNEVKKRLDGLEKSINIKDGNIYLITSKKKEGSYFFEFIYRDKYSYAMFNQIRTFNAKRILKYHGKIRKDDFINLKKKFQEFLC